MGFIDFVFALSILISAVTALVIWFRINKGQVLSANLLATYLFLNAFCFSFYLIIVYGYIIEVPYLYKVPAPITLLLPPLGYLYVRTVLFREKHLNPNDLWHLLPFLVMAINYFPLYSLPADTKAALVQAVSEDLSVSYTVQEGYLPEWVNIVLRTLSSFAYLGLQWNMLLRFFKRKSNSETGQQKMVRKWLFDFTRLITFYCCSLLLIYIASGFLSIKLFTENGFGFILSRFLTAVSFLAISGYLLWNPELLIGLTKMQYKMHRGDDQSLGEAKRTLALLEKSIGEKELYLNPKLTLAHLALELKIPARKISKAISSSEHQNFNEFINSFRVGYAQVKIKEGYMSKHSIEALGKISGFHSKNAFYRAFKKTLDCTPKEYGNRLEPKQDRAMA